MSEARAALPPGPITVASLLRAGVARLAACLPDARFDAELLLAHAVGLPRAALVTRPAQPVSPTAAARFEALVAERATGRPVAQLLGEWEFYGLALFIDEHVLVPRPETEGIVDWARALAPTPSAQGTTRHALSPARALDPRRIADLCTGSGCLAIALATVFPAAELHATDLSEAALDVARRNVRRHHLEARVHVHTGDLLAPLDGRFDLIVCNPPYVAVDDPLLDPHVARHEPALALIDPSGDGLGFYRRLAREAPPRLASRGVLMVEIGDGQAAAVRTIFEGEHWTVEVRPDLAGIERLVLARR